MTEKLALKSMVITEEKKKALKKLFPEVFTEGKIDFERLKQVLGDAVDSGRERYGLMWAGKSEAIKNIQTQSIGTLRPVPEESVNFDTAKNLIIEGDNLEVLKLLQKSYYGKVKMIYIDPPYNKGNNDFIYPDNYREGLENYLRYTGQIDENGVKLTTNTETNGRYHSKWLNMMYPRLFLARNLLKEDGVIFVSIDDNEVHNLRAIMDEIFGEENFLDQLIWAKNSTKNDSKDFATVHEYIVCYAKNKQYRREKGLVFREPKPGYDYVMNNFVEKWNKTKPRLEDATRELREFYRKNRRRFKGLSQYKYVEIKDGRYFIYRKDNAAWPQGDGPKYEVLHPVTKKPCKTPERGWRWKYETMQELLKNDLICFGEDESTVPQFKRYLDTVDSNVVKSLIINNDNGEVDLRNLLDTSFFDHPKPVSLISQLVSITTSSEDIILDFFAGSGTTGHSVLEINQLDGGNRKFILVQLPEPTDNPEYPTISEITKERIRRVINKIKQEDELEINQQDLGFKVFMLDSSNFKIWDGEIEDPNKLRDQLEMFTDNIKEDRSEEDLLYEIVLKAGYMLTEKIEAVTVGETKVYSVKGGEMLVCLSRKLDSETIEGIMDLEPKQVICLDLAFMGNDQLKTNTVLQMKSKGIKFRTV